MKQLLTTFVLLTIHLIGNAQSGSYDATFGTGGIIASPYVNSQEYNSVRMHNNMYLVAGSAFINGTDRLVLARYTQTGQLDNTFGISGVSNTTEISTGTFTEQGIEIQTQSSGKLMVLSNNFVTRFTANGILDTTFYKMPFGFSNFIGLDFVVQANDKIMVCGYEATGADNGQLVKLTANGTYDSTFGINGIKDYSQATFSTYAIFSSMVRQPDGKYLIVGKCSDVGLSFPDGYENLIMRVDSNGNLDNTFNSTGYKRWNSGASGENSAIQDIVLQPDGKILVSGDIINSTGSSVGTFIARLNAAGSMDTGFGTNGTFYENSTSSLELSTINLALQNDGGIVWIGNNSLTFLYTPVCIKLKANGQKDASFGSNGIAQFPISIKDYDVRNGMLDNNSKIVVVGGSIDLNTFESGYFIARIGNGATTSGTENLLAATSIQVYPNPCHDLIQLTSSEINLVNDQITFFDLLGRPMLTSVFKPQGIDVSSLSNGSYLLQLKHDENIYQTMIQIAR
ncbi:MAG: T9SS type A sorting domain-containing protein [Chitinophagaceae bacterium]|nr:T9SS type A sorting domain-containing protein [Chitinophagaceae bacterium]